MEEAHRYLHGESSNASEMVQQIVKEGRKYGIGAMIVSQRPSEVDETVLSQCGTFFGLRLSNSTDRGKVKGTLPDSLAGLMDMLPVLRTGEAIITGEAATLPIRCRILLPEKLPNSRDPKVAEQWGNKRRSQDFMEDIYEQIAASWRAQSPTRPKNPELSIERNVAEDSELKANG
ncbi:MAG: ATP-binding protein [Bdellovibrionales bacterium]|nr:ATP-binding protein [Bdellovibrionales bacterium]